MNIHEIVINESVVKKILSQSKSEDLIETEPITSYSSVRTGEFFKMLKNSFSFSSEILPKNCKFITKNMRNDKFLIIEDEPKIRTISVNMDLSGIIERHKINGKFEEYGLKNFNINKRPYLFTLSFPYIIYCIQLDNFNKYENMSVYFRLHPLTSFNDYLLIPCLSNIDSNFNVCLGEVDRKQNTKETINEIISRFWNNSFNFDYFSHVKKYEDTAELTDYFTWAHNTKIDPLFIFSAKWKPINDFSISDIINDFNNDSNDDFIEGFFHYLNNSIDKDIEEFDKYGNVEIVNNREYSESIITPNGKSFSVGDEIIFDGQNYYIKSFMMKYQNKNIFEVHLEDEEGNIKAVEIENFNNYVDNQIQKIEIETAEINGETYSKNDLVSCSFSNDKTFRTIDKFIKLRDNTFQVKIGNEFYLPCLFGNKIKKIDLNNLEIFGLKIKIGENYEFMNLNESAGILIKCDGGAFEKISTQRSDLILSFLDQNGKEIKIPSSGIGSNYLPINNSSISRLYRVNNYLFVNDESFPHSVSLLKDQGLGIKSKNSDTLYMPNISTFLKYQMDICKNYIFQSNDQINIPSFDFDLNYKLGDELIYINWEIPAEMLKIRKLVSFEEKQNKLYFNLIDDLNNISSFLFIDFITGKIYSEAFRKVCREIDDNKIGTKVVSSISGICGFPKKDCNEIKAFIIDEYETLVLFSNYKTLYYSDFLELDFNKYYSSDKKYNKLKNTTDTGIRDKLLEGDLIKINDLEYVIGHDKYSSKLVAYSISLPPVFCKQIQYNTIYSRLGLLYPRNTEIRIKSFRAKKGFFGTRSNLSSTILNNYYNFGLVKKDWRV